MCTFLFVVCCGFLALSSCGANSTIEPRNVVLISIDTCRADRLGCYMKRKGYRTAAVVGAMVLESRFGLDQGFDTYDDRFSDAREDIFLERKGLEVSRVAGSWLEENRDGRNFLFLHYFDPHANYRPPEPYAGEFADEPYAGEVAYTDWCIGEVIEKLKALELYDSSLSIITADHGEALGEHSEVTHAYYIYQSTLRVGA